MSNKPSYNIVESVDDTQIANLSSRLFSQTFAHLYKQEDLHHFLSTAHSPQAVKLSIASGAKYLLAINDKTPVGFIKYGTNGLPTGTNSTCEFEIKQLYLDQSIQGQSIGQQLLDLTMKNLLELNAKILYLGVWSENYRAQKFYKRNGFSEFACYWFPVGRHIDKEIIMKLEMT